ncbi:MAG: hypothetical protein AABX93_01450 [Nanoarchaeota archaeon]
MVMKNKFGQLKIQQMAFMLMAITLFFALVGMFFLTIQVSKIRESASVLEEKNALLLVTRLANSPEFSCGNSFGITAISCVDSDKIMALKNKAEDYNGFWGTSNIEIRKIYPATNPVECTSSNYPNCNIIKINEEEIESEYSNFVSLCRKEIANGQTYNKCELAKLMAGYNG